MIFLALDLAGEWKPVSPRLTRYIFNVVTMIGVLLFRSQWMDEGVCLSGWIFYSVLFLFCSGRHNVTFLYLLLCISNLLKTRLQLLPEKNNLAI